MYSAGVLYFYGYILYIIFLLLSEKKKQFLTERY